MAAADPAPPSRVWPVLALAASSAAVSQAFGRFTFSLLFTDVRTDLGLSNSRAGSLGSANLLAYLTGTLVVSLLVGRVGLTRTTRLGVVGVTTGVALLAWSPGAVVVAVALVLTGLFAAGVWVTVPAIAAAAVGPERRGAAIGVVGAGIGAGIMVAAALHAAPFADDWRGVYRVEAAVAVLVAVAALWRLRGSAGPARTGSGFVAMRSVPAWQRLLLSYGLYGLAMSLMVTFLVAVLREDAGYTVGEASAAFFCFGGGTIAGGPLFGPLADRVGRPRAMHVAYAVMVGSALLIGTGARPWATIAAALFGTAFTGVPTTVAAHMSDAIAAERFGAAYGVATLAFGAGLMIGPQAGGVMGDVTGSFRPVFWSAAAVAVVAASLVRPGDGVTRPA